MTRPTSAPARPLRSWLFVPGDAERKLAKVDGCGADVVIVDLEDAVAPARKEAARQLVAAFLADRPAGSRREQLWVRVNPLGAGAAEDLDAVLAGRPDGIVQPKPDGPHDVRTLGDLLAKAEHRLSLPGRLPILPVATETAIAPFRLGDYAGAGLDRLAGLTWGAEDLAAALGATGNRGADGEWLFTYRLVRSLTLMAAHAAGVPAIETLQADFRDEAGLEQSSRQARAEGFTGRLAIHPAQVPVINAAFTPSPAEVEHARAVVAAFAADPGAGVVALEGRMLDGPHLKAATRTLALAEPLNPGPTAAAEEASAP